MIAPNVFLSAAHAHPSSTVTFNATNSLGETTFTYSIRNQQRVGSTDLWIGAFYENVDPSIMIYDYATEFLSNANFGTSYLNGADVYMVGRSPGTGDFAVGENVVNAYYENVNIFGQPDVDLLQMDYNVPADGSSYRKFESYFQSGDSGGPTFAIVNGELQLLGTNCCITTAPDPLSSLISYTGNQADEIADFISANAVPEPSSGMLLSMLVIFCFARRRRRYR
jgi:hypothetical protein